MQSAQKDVILFLCEQLNIPEPGMYTQDWEWEMADADRLDEFIRFYIDNRLDDQVKIKLMELIISSLDDKIGQSGYCESDWIGVKKLLQKDRELHRQIILYWARTEAQTDDECFAVTKYIRQLL